MPFGRRAKPHRGILVNTKKKKKKKKEKEKNQFHSFAPKVMARNSW